MMSVLQMAGANWKRAADDFHLELLNTSSTWTTLFGGKRPAWDEAQDYKSIEANIFDPPGNIDVDMYSLFLHVCYMLSTMVYYHYI